MHNFRSKSRRLVLIVAGLILGITGISARDFAIKTNVVGDALLSPNLGVEFGVAPRWSIDVTGEMNAWTMSHERRWKHWYAMPEARYWFCDRWDGWFLAGHVFGGQYNIGGFNGHWNMLGTNATLLKDYRFQGWYVGAGIGAGYSWILSRHWNIETELGLGWSYTRYDRFKCQGCGKKLDTDKPHNYVGPTKAAVNVIYVF